MLKKSEVFVVFTNRYRHSDARDYALTVNEDTTSTYTHCFLIANNQAFGFSDDGTFELEPWKYVTDCYYGSHTVISLPDVSGHALLKKYEKKRSTYKYIGWDRTKRGYIDGVFPTALTGYSYTCAGMIADMLNLPEPWIYTPDKLYQKLYDLSRERYMHFD